MGATTSEAPEVRRASSENGGARDMKRNRSNLAIMCFLAAVDGADIAILPASFRAMEVDLGLKPTQLSILAGVQGVAMALSLPFWGNLADSGFPRKRILAGGAMAWGTLTLVLAFAVNFNMMVGLRLLNGAALGTIIPLIQSLIPEISLRRELAVNFGVIDFGNKLLGQALATFVVASISQKIMLGVEGWRLAFISIGVASFGAAFLVHACFSEARRTWRPANMSVMREFQVLLSYFRIPTFLAIVLQGIFGQIPWYAMSFATMYFQYIGFPDTQAGLFVSLIVVGAGLGSIVGGLISDGLTRWKRFAGRPLTAQMSVLLGIPVAYVLFNGAGGGSATANASLCFTLGFLGSWCNVGCNRPIFCDIVSLDNRSSAYAWMYCIDTTSGSLFGPTIVGILSEQVFNYHSNRDSFSNMSPKVRADNTDALAKSLLIGTVCPWIVCFLLYTSLLFTYQRDVEALRNTSTGGNHSSYSEDELAPLREEEEEARTV